MVRCKPLITPVIALLALGASAVPVAAQDADVPGDDIAAPEQASSGEVVAMVDADGGTAYFLELEDGTLIELRFGPAWFWGPLDPLDALVGTTVELSGPLAVDGPDEHASETGQQHAADQPKLHVRSVDGTPLRSHGKPPWAGGPKVVGEVHPGYAGSSSGEGHQGANGHANGQGAAGASHGPDQD
jgi:hypothetical protein